MSFLMAEPSSRSDTPAFQESVVAVLLLCVFSGLSIAAIHRAEPLQSANDQISLGNGTRIGR